MAVGLGFAGALGAGAYALLQSAAESGARKTFSATGAPIDVRVAAPETFSGGTPWGHYYVIPTARVSGPDAVGRVELDKMSRSEGFRDDAWELGHGGVAGSPQLVRLEVRGKTAEPVTVTRIAIEVVRRSSPVNGWYIAAPGCGAESVRTAVVDLDQPSRPVVYVAPSGEPLKRLALFVTQTDSEQIELQAATRRSTVEWRARVFYSGPHGDGAVEIDDQGHPFRVTTEIGSSGFEPAFSGVHAKLRRDHDWDNGLHAC